MKNGNSHFENDITHIALKSSPSGTKVPGPPQRHAPFSLLRSPPRRVPLAAGRPPPCRIIALRHAQTAHRSFLWCKVCDYVRIYDEDEGCGVSADSQKFNADSSGYKGKTLLKDDIHNDAACFDVYLK